jgi:hypothetical protein
MNSKKQEKKSLFDEVGEEFEKMEKEKSPFALAFRSIKVMLKILWRSLIWMIRLVNSLISRLRQREQEEPRPVYTFRNS